MRLDRLLSEMNIGTRSQIKDYVRQKRVQVNGIVAQKADQQVQPEVDQISFDGKPISFESFQYYMLNKPQEVVSATKDKLSDTVLSLLPKDHRSDLFPVGRLDKDTEGLLLISNDGALSHQLLSPKKHVWKTYLVQLAKPIGTKELQALEEGVDIGDETPTLPAIAVVPRERNDGAWLRLTIHEGRFHQVKRMLEAVGNEVIYLKRLRFGPLLLDPGLSQGECRKLTSDEIRRLKEYRSLATEKHEMLRDVKAVIFDLDGSLIDSMWVWTRIDEEYLDMKGFGNVDREALRVQIEGMTFHETAVFFKEHFSMPDDIEKIKADWSKMAWDKYEKEVLLKPGALEFLNGCKKLQIRLGIATSNSRELSECVLKANLVKNMFDTIVTGSEVSKGKPDPDIYLKAARQLNVDPKDCLVFEDTLAGVMAGKNAGMKVCSVADKHSENTLSERQKVADYSVEDFYDFFE